jgi:hypothetical protein
VIALFVKYSTDKIPNFLACYHIARAVKPRLAQASLMSFNVNDCISFQMCSFLIPSLLPYTRMDQGTFSGNSQGIPLQLYFLPPNVLLSILHFERPDIPA